MRLALKGKIIKIYNMKKEKTSAKNEVKTDVAATEVSHIRAGHKWLAWITGITAVWVLITFVLGLAGDMDLPRSMCYLNVWYLVNLGIIAALAVVSTVGILKKCPEQIFVSGSTMYLLLLQSVSLIILYFYKQDAAAINGVAMFVWGICWYTYMLTAPAVETDVPSVHRRAPMVAKVIVGVMTVSTVAYAIMMSINLLW